jgi:hypothetical protein
VSNPSIDSIEPSWSPTGAKIVFIRPGDNNNVWTINSNGTGMAAVTVDGSFADPVYSPDGTRFAAEHFGVNSEIATIGANGFFTEITTGSGTRHTPSWSPDGRMIAYSQLNASSRYELVASSAAGQDPHMIVTGGNQDVMNPAWSPFPGRRTLVGAGASLGTTAAGFVFSQTNDNINGFVAFNAPTPTGVTLTAQAANGSGQNQIFTISGGGGINSLKYTNDPLFPATTVIPNGSLTSAKSVIVSLNTTDGHVSLVVPFSKGLAHSVNPANGNSIYHGSIEAIWDSKGKNLAPKGATFVEVSPETGRLVSSR